MSMRAKYSIEAITDTYIFIKDTGKYDKSVTNDAENVVKELYQSGILGNRRLYYEDSVGDVDEMVHRDGYFLRFNAGF